MSNSAPNTLYYGDNLQILRERIATESVDLCYIDPPFNSQQDYNQIYSTAKRKDAAQTQAFTDTWTWDTQAALGFQAITANEGGRFQSETIELFRGLRAVLKESSLLAYLVSMTLRLVEIHRTLKPSGSFYLHCDPTASHYLKLIADSIFGRREFQNEVIWKRTTTKNDYQQGAVNWPRIHDVLLYYTKERDANPTFIQPFSAYGDDYVASKYPHKDSNGRRYGLWDVTAPGSGSRGHPQYEFMGVTRFWRYNEEKMKQLLAEGRIIQPRPGAVPRYKRFFDEMRGVAIGDFWEDISAINSQAQERLGYPTQKPEALMERIIKASSSEGDVILDAYCGCGTTVAVAERLKRRWIGIDITYQSISLILKRLEDTFGADVLKSVSVDGIPRDVEAAEALATGKDDRTRKEFEKWAVLTYSNNRAVINQKKGADQGIDGVAYFATAKHETEKTVFQVKSGKVQRGDVAKLDHDRQRESAELATLITLQEPTRAMREEAATTGIYRDALMGRDMHRVQIVTVAELLAGKRMELPLATEVLKAAPRAKGEAEQGRMF